MLEPLKKSCRSIGYSLPSVADTVKFSISLNISESYLSDSTGDDFTKVEGACLGTPAGCNFHIETEFDPEKLTWTHKSGEKINDKFWLRTKGALPMYPVLNDVPTILPRLNYHYDDKSSNFTFKSISHCWRISSSTELLYRVDFDFEDKLGYTGKFSHL